MGRHLLAEDALMHRFYLPDAPDDERFECTLSAEESQHAGRVLRLRAGDEVECFNGRGRAWKCEIDFHGSDAHVRAISELPSNESELRVTIYQGLPKLDKLDLIVQKATELGACRIVPVNMARSVARAEGKDAAKKRERWQRIAIEAAKQCGRACVPEVVQPISFAQALDDMRGRELMLMPYELHRGKGIAALDRGAHDVGVLIGPEGGIDAAEAERAQAAGALPITLGPRILRTETAAIATLAMLMLHMGDAGGEC